MDSASPILSQSHTRLTSPRNDEKESETNEEPKDMNLEDLKAKGMKEVENQKKRELEKMDKEKKARNKYGKVGEIFIMKSKEFVQFTKTEMCDEMIVAGIYYVSSSLALTMGPPLDDDQIAEQEEIQGDSLKILSSLYCQLLMSPFSANLPVRSERIFYETLIFYIDACISFAIHTAPSDKITELIGEVFRGGIKDPQTQQEVEFLPITEIVKKHWLSQRVPGKNRATIKHSTLRGTTKLVEPLVEIPEKHDRIRTRADARAPPPKPKRAWDENGFPLDTRVPFREKVIPGDAIVQIPQPKPTSEPISTVVTRETTPRKQDAV